jgi:hypothetical protein
MSLLKELSNAVIFTRRTLVIGLAITISLPALSDDDDGDIDDADADNGAGGDNDTILYSDQGDLGGRYGLGFDYTLRFPQLDLAADLDDTASDRNSNTPFGSPNYLGLSFLPNGNEAQTTVGVPSPVTGGDSIFDRVNAQYEKLFRSESRNASAATRLGNLAVSLAHEENDTWARDEKRGPYQAGQPKCNVAIAEMTIKAGLEPFYTKSGSFADTRYMMAHPDSFSCWKPTDQPQKGDVGVYPFHTFVVVDPEKGTGASAASDTMKIWTNWADDEDGVHRVIFRSASEANNPNFQSNSEVLFFEYHCPDQKIQEAFFYDDWGKR